MKVWVVGEPQARLAFCCDIPILGAMEELYDCGWEECDIGDMTEAAGEAPAFGPSGAYGCACGIGKAFRSRAAEARSNLCEQEHMY